MLCFFFYCVHCRQQAKLFEERMSSVFSGVDGAPNGDQINLTFQKMAEAAALAVQNVTDGGANAAEPQLADSLTEALKSLKEGSDILQEPIPPEGLSGMFQGLQLDEDGGDNPFLPVMQGMMQSLLSAEVLLPSLKELLEKYPTWMQENETKITAEDKERYAKQQELFKIICAELEKEKPTDSAEVKNERFKVVLKHMQKVNSFDFGVLESRFLIAKFHFVLFFSFFFSFTIMANHQQIWLLIQLEVQFHKLIQLH